MESTKINDFLIGLLNSMFYHLQCKYIHFVYKKALKQLFFYKNCDLRPSYMNFVKETAVNVQQNYFMLSRISDGTPLQRTYLLTSPSALSAVSSIEFS